ncbi:universal stress protein [Acinetobacter terrae]|jgi:nucleotide-binding universal stress UspA family protein|uniref:Universal stress protein n=1 Tax=Acinetobacter terrae TaxID=2731247 RepID=A0A2C9WSF7_9GAMM|nr:universal stress protein [Acinetobacter terrae]NNG75135.1 universal stress protein [Acinetobacter terrae]NNH16206.1 universal stress protein [Acinetobacter terrae]NNH37251.1 universal stress protein [Acinetobacter terrae]NNH77954.1 universal stress protein [Acinetobacter terrae]NNH86167.1 universal stress protein [Acinetobacter terrae]
MSYQNILVPVDGSDISLSAVKNAAQIAQAFGGQLTLISLVTEDPFSEADFYYPSPIMKEYFVQAYANAEKALKQAQAIASENGITANTQIVKGNVSEEGIIETAEKLKIDLIVMGSHGRKGFQKFLLGSFAQDVLKGTKLPVLIVKE